MMRPVIEVKCASMREGYRDVAPPHKTIRDYYGTVRGLLRNKRTATELLGTTMQLPRN